MNAHVFRGRLVGFRVCSALASLSTSLLGARLALAQSDAPVVVEPAAPAAAEAAAPSASEVVDEAQATTEVASFAVTPLKDSPAVVTVLSGEDIRTTGARDLIDVLSLVPGFFFGVDTEGVVGPGFRGLWGHEGKILLLIDGKEMNELLFSNMQLGNEFPVELIERVEVVRGPGSVIYGGSAELAVINVVTRSLQGASDVLATATYGQMTDAKSLDHGYARRKMTLSGRYVVDSVPGLSTFASVSWGQGQRSVRNYVDNAGTAVSMEGNSALDPFVAQAGVGYRNIQATLLYQRLGMTSVDGAGTALSSPLALSFSSLHGELSGTFRPTNRLELVPRLNAIYQRPWSARTLDDYYYDKSISRLRARFLARWAALDELQITVGVDGITDHAKLLGPAGQGVQAAFAGGANEVSYQTLGTFAELYSENPLVNVSAGARYDHHSAVGSALVPRLVLLRNLGPVSLKGLFSLSFRAPSVENINGAVATANGGTIRPEHTRVLEFEGAVELGAAHRLSANAYDVAIDAPIAYTHDPNTNGDGYLNLGKQGTRGIELAYRLRTPQARLDANYSFYVPTLSENIGPYVVAGHTDQFLGAPSHRAALFATFRPWQELGLVASPTAIFLGPRYARGPLGAADAENASKLPAQLLFNLVFSKENLGTPGLSLSLGIYNLFGAQFRYVHASAPGTFYDDHAPLPGLDREVLVRLTYASES